MRSTTQTSEAAHEPATPGYVYAPGALESLSRAALRLRTLPEALRARCESAAQTKRKKDIKDIAVIHLGDGVVGFLSRGEWRFRFPVAAVVDTGDALGSPVR